MVTYLPATAHIHDDAVRENFEYIESHAIFVLPDNPLVVTGSRGGNAALASLLTQLAAAGIIVDSTTP